MSYEQHKLNAFVFFQRWGGLGRTGKWVWSGFMVWNSQYFEKILCRVIVAESSVVFSAMLSTTVMLAQNSHRHANVITLWLLTINVGTWCWEVKKLWQKRVHRSTDREGWFLGLFSWLVFLLSLFSASYETGVPQLSLMREKQGRIPFLSGYRNE